VNRDELLPHVYPELRRLAAAKLAADRPGRTLDAPALIHDAFIKLGGKRAFASPFLAHMSRPRTIAMFARAVADAIVR